MKARAKETRAKVIAESTSLRGPLLFVSLPTAVSMRLKWLSGRLLIAGSS
jgi:hypothetical protein